ncbi:MAG TPA: translation elongation factor 4 [Candidatus Hydrogenedentes bacterium]|nr:translation elongation factor 4 [Candidatus Hydrogenedentota bacterium]HOL75670.1 translation elongation factor 4 [Candidatus Hydrogenedentota bacterium]HPO84337.1 translation elongation factor 4 [Candidatus Hydrogenedentota bacterium]
MSSSREHIRNFCIIAHVDHGKSTLADRILELTGAVDPRNLKEQTLDTMDIERERGITIKAVAVRLTYKAQDGQTYVLNLIDTPGHVDFSYEVSRSLAACEGAVLLVDAAQGVEAQTLAHFYRALEQNLEIIPVINKIDLPSADIDSCRRQITEVLGLEGDEAILASAKEGTGTREVLEAVVKRIPSPKGDPDAPLRALIFDAVYDSYRGVIVYIRIVDGRATKGQEIVFMSSGDRYDIVELGVFRPAPDPMESLETGEVGYLICNIKTLRSVKIGDTVTDVASPAKDPLPGYEQIKPVVFCGLYPAAASDYEELRNALEKLQLNDASFVFQADNSDALGFGFRLGFLGLLHMEIIQERLEREFNLSLVATTPNVAYKVTTVDGKQLVIENASKLPPPNKIAEIAEPYIEAEIICPTEYLSSVIELCKRKRGVHVRVDYIDNKRCMAIYQMPLAEIVLDFYDKLKSCTRGYGSLEYRLIGFRPDNLVKLDILLNGDPVDALSCIVHRDRAEAIGRTLAQKLRKLIPRQQFEVAIQAAIGSRILVRETIKPLRKNVTAKCYGGDITRKRKLLEKQKEGKKRMKQIGNVEVPQEAFMALLSVGDEIDK